nr:uroporphyrinogen decarboxylase [Marinithermus hydrothermalis]
MASVNEVFLKAARGETTPYTPVWFMRQAGRYQPEYRKIRERYTLPEIVRHPEVTAEVTKLPVAQLGVDAAILFADITTPLYGMGFDLDIVEGKGPVIHNPIRTPKDLHRLQPFDPKAHTPFVLEAIRLLKEDLEVPLIGFAGAPFTLASYLIEGGPTRNFVRVKAFMYAEEEAWHQLMRALTEAMIAYLTAQVHAGADAVQVFDSWVGHLTASDYRRYVKPHMQRLFAGLSGLGVPTIHFGTRTMHLLEEMQAAGGQVIGVDHTTPFDWARARLGATPVQGNLDPAVLFAPWPVVEREVLRVLEANAGRAGHIFNLGHGILPGTPVETVQRVVAFVHERTQR